MYPVSDAFMQAIKSNTRKYYWTGTITTSDKKTYEFGNEDIPSDSAIMSGAMIQTRSRNPRWSVR